MKNLKNLLKKNWAVSIIYFAGFIGFVDAMYLSAVRYLGGIPDCKIVSGCEEVLNSSYAVIASIPVSVFGVVYYAAILILINMIVVRSSARLINWIRICATMGMAASMYFLYIQAFVLDAWCIYCLISVATSVIIFCGSLKLKSKMKNEGGVVT